MHRAEGCWELGSASSKWGEEEKGWFLGDLDPSQDVLFVLMCVHAHACMCAYTSVHEPVALDTSVWQVGAH